MFAQTAKKKQGIIGNIALFAVRLLIGKVGEQMDREKVIQGLEHCMIMCEGVSHNPCKGCLYQGRYDCADTLKADALALLKEQEQEIAFLKKMQLQTIGNMSEEDIGNSVAKILGIKGW